MTLNNSVVRVDAGTGIQATLSSGTNFQASANIAIESNGDILVVDREAFSGLGGVFRVDPVNGTQTVISSGGNFLNPFGMAVESNGQILISDYATDSVYRVDPVTGDQSLLSQGGHLQEPLEIEISHVSVAGKVGDINLDGVINLLDVAPFIDLLSTGTFQLQADFNQDGVVNLLDVEPFIALLGG